MSEALAARLALSLPDPSTAPVGLRELSHQARGRFIELGLPDTREESWRYSPLRGLENLVPAAAPLGSDLASHAALPGVDSCLARLRGGQWELPEAPPSGVRIQLLASASMSARLANLWLPSDDDRSAAFAWLNAADARQVLLVEVDRVVAGRHSLELLHDVIGLAQCRVILHLHAGARINILEHWRGSAAASGLCNFWLQVRLDLEAELDWLRLQETGQAARTIQRTEFALGSDSRITHHAVELGGQWTRHDLRFALDGAQAELTSNGVFALSGRQHLDTQLAIDHGVGGASSRTLWKGVAQGRARAIFDGAIAVRPGADGTKAHLKTANLLLSPHAEIDAKPELIIEADEVQCSHGATVGRLDERALFYLRSRGLPESLARRMLTVAFCAEALRDIKPDSLREEIEARVIAHLPEITTAGSEA